MKNIGMVFVVAILAAALATLSAPGAALARTTLVALPERGATIINLANPQAALIEEERVLTLQAGINKVDFSWKGVRIDPDSIRLAPLSHPADVSLLSVSYPPGESTLVWDIGSREAFEEKVRISYLLSGIDRLIAYKLSADREEKTVDFKSFLILRNFSGENFDRVRVRLDHGRDFDLGLGHEETKQLLFLTPGRVPLAKVWTFDAALEPWDPELEIENIGIPVSYEVANVEASGLGGFVLDPGKTRVFQDDGAETSIFLGEDQAGKALVGEKMKVGIGRSRDIVITQRKTSERKVNVRRNKNNDVVLFDLEEGITAKIENFKKQPAVLTMIQHIPGEWDMVECNLKYEKKDAETLEFKVDLPAGGRQALTMRYIRRNIRP
ncbi:MAG: hypothetical protein V1816_11160 [Pseudomonadota bacterium]